MARFEILENLSNLSLQGQTSLHAILASTDKLAGAFDIEVTEPGVFDLSAPMEGSLEIYVDDLRTESYLDVAVRDRLNTRRYPKIVASLTGMRPHEDEAGRFLATGDITFHGETCSQSSEISVRWMDDDTIEVKGEIWIDVREFKVELPKMITSSVEPDVRARLRLMLKRKV